MSKEQMTALEQEETEIFERQEIGMKSAEEIRFEDIIAPLTQEQFFAEQIGRASCRERV